jgi:undecaprenyl diphosphate synthase
VSPTPAAKAGAEAGAATTSGSGDHPVPRHVAIIMDGNGRWAAQRGLPRAAGHRAGAEAVRATLRAAAEAGVEVLTLYAFSSENWRRSDEEVTELKGLLA